MILPNSSAFNFRIDFSSSSLNRLIIDSKSIFESSKLANKDFKKFRLKPKNAQTSGDSLLSNDFWVTGCAAAREVDLHFFGRRIFSFGLS